MTNDHYIYGIAFGCPVISRMKECPLKEIDSLSFNEKVDWMKNLSQGKKNEIFEQHKICSKSRVLEKVDTKY